MAIFESLSTGCIEFEDYIVNGTVEDLKKYIETEKKLGGTSIKYYFAFNHAVEKAMDVSEEKFELICDSLQETEEGDVYDVIFNDIQIRFRGSLLCLAAAKGNIPAIKYLLKKGGTVAYLADKRARKKTRKEINKSKRELKKIKARTKAEKKMAKKAGGRDTGGIL